MGDYDLSVVQNAAESALRRRKREKRRRIALVVSLSLVAAASALGIWFLSGQAAQPAPTGAVVSSPRYEGMTRDEIQARLDAQVQASMMTVAVSPVLVLEADGTVSLTVSNDAENTMPQRFAISQGGVDIYESERLDPGQTVTSCAVEGLAEGVAVVTVQGLDGKTGEPKGSPAAVEVTVRSADDIG